MAPNQKPLLTILAGPNGAGKSVFAKKLIKPKTIHFDRDKVITEIERVFESKYQGLPTLFEIIEKEVGNQFFNAIKQAIEEKKD